MTAASIVAQITVRIIMLMTKEIEELVRNLVGEGVDMYAMEQQTFAVLQRIGQQVIAQVAEAKERLQGEVRCERCRQILRGHSRRRRVVLTLFGATSLERRYYYCRSCRWGECALDRTLKLTRAQVGKALKEVLLVLGVQQSYERAARTLEKVLKVAISRQTVLNHLRQVGEEVMLKEALEQKLVEQRGYRVPSVAEAPQRLYLGMDATKAHVHGAWRDVKVGTIFAGEASYDENGQREADQAIRPLAVARLAEAEAFVSSYRLEAIKQGALRAKECLCLSDAGNWIYDRLKSEFPRLIGIVDWFHARDHLLKLSHLLFGEGTEAARTWFEKQQTILWNQGGKGMVAALQRSRKLGAHDHPEVTVHREYFVRHQHKMDYPRYRAAGYQIGSGILESNCDVYVGQRAKLPGMRWKDGLNAVLAVRTHWLNQTFDSCVLPFA